MTGIAAKVRRGERLSAAEGLQLLTSTDLLTLGRLADQARRDKVGDAVYFVVNTHLNHTNVCWLNCKFCAFSRRPGDPEAYLMDPEEVESRCASLAGRGFRELHIVGGVHPGLRLEYYEAILRAARRRLPEIMIQAFTAVEVDYLAGKAGLSLSACLERLRAAGLDALPGGGAEIFAPRVRELVCPHKIGADRWLEVHAAAHALGIRSNATLLYGHLERPDEVVDHLIRLRELQDHTGGFLAFAGFAFHPENTALAREYGLSGETTGYEDLRLLAVARLLLDNFAHVKAFWMTMGLKLAQVSLSFGVNDLDGTVMEERIVHAAGAETGQMVPKEEFIELIRQAGRVPVERDTLYRVIRTYQAPRS